MPRPTYWVWILAVITALPAAGAPIPGHRIKLNVAMEVYQELGYINSSYNPRHFGGKNFVGQLGLSGQQGIARYPAGSSVAEASLDFSFSSSNTESRMWAPMDGGQSTQHVLLAGGSNESRFSRLDYATLQNRIFAGPASRPNAFDWVDQDTILFTSDEPALRGNVYLADVQNEPFQVTLNMTWNANGFATTAAARIRNARVGDAYAGYAYYGESQTAANARFWALDLTTGVSTELGSLPTVTGSGSWGLWTVKEMDGFLYLQTSDDGIYVYRLANATTLGPLAVHYDAAMLEALTGYAGQHWGFDVVEKGKVMLLSGFARVFEIGTFADGDFNRDGFVNNGDLDEWRNQFGDAGAALPADGDFDADVDGADFLLWQRNLDANPILSELAFIPIPEPSSVAIASMLLLMMAMTFNKTLRDIRFSTDGQ